MRAGPEDPTGVAVIYLLLIVYRIWIYKAYHRKEEMLGAADISLDKREMELVEAARRAALMARAPLSGYRVGAAILGQSGSIYVGCNIEFENYSNTIHAEEGAISAFVSAGEQKALTIAVFTPSVQPSFPCGMCRQSLFELGGSSLRVIASNAAGTQIRTMAELLPSGFRLGIVEQ